MVRRVNRFTAASKQAAANTDETLADDLYRLNHIDDQTLEKLFPNDINRMYFNKLIRKLNKCTKNNLRIAAYKDFVKKAGTAAIKAVKNIMEGA